MASDTYFITGGFGFLGQYVVKAIHDHDPLAELRVFDLAPRPTLVDIENIPRVRHIFGDLRRPESLSAVMDGVDTVIHTAGLVFFKRADRDALFHSNIDGMLNLLQASLSNGCRTFVYISSISAVGLQPGQLSDETMIPNLEVKRVDDPYGYTKLMGERALQAENGWIRGIILNPSVILGPGSRRIEKVVSWLRWSPFFPMITTLNSFVDVRDVAKAVVLALTEGRSGERYIVTAANVGMLAFTRTVLSLMRKRALVIPVPEGLLPLGDRFVGLLDALRINPGIRKLSAVSVDKAYSSEKIRLEMGWQPVYSLEESLRDTLFPGGSSRNA